MRAVPAISPSAGVRAISSSSSRRIALRGDREAAVLDEAALVDEVGEVLARRARAARVASLDRLGPRLVAGQPPALEHLGEVVSHVGSPRLRSTAHTLDGSGTGGQRTRRLDGDAVGRALRRRD